MKNVVAYSLAFCFIITQTSCFGSFELTKKIYDWNDGIHSDKFVKSLFMWLLMIIPVYQVGAALDLIIFNLIEFWSGTNPVAMSEGDIEQESIIINGNEYLVTATKNQFRFEKVNGDSTEEIGVLRFVENDKKWLYEKDGELTEVAKINEDFSITYYTEQGDLIVSKDILMSNSPQASFAAK